MDFFTLIGGSVVYEEHKGDYTRARQIVDADVAAAQSANDPAALADALISAGIVDLLQGEPPTAIECFDRVAALLPNDARRCLRAASYRHWAVFQNFNAFPGGPGSNSAEVSARWQGVPYLQEEHPRWQTLLNAVADPAAKMEAWLVHQILPNLLPARATLESCRFAPSGPEVAQMLEGTLQGLTMFRDAIGFFPYGDLAAADLCRRAGRQAAGLGHLEKACAGYEQAGDAAGMAVCELTRGDWLAAPFSSPLAMNFLLAEGSSEGSDFGWQTEKAEASRDALDAAGANTAYDCAERLFEQAGAPRGLAAVSLRRAWLAAVSDDFQGASDLTRQACGAFENCGDILGLRLARTHLAIYQVSAGQRPAPVELTAAVGAWGRERGSFSYTLGLGLLVNRAARHWLVRQRDYERATGCHLLAQALFTALGASSNRAQCLIDRGQAHQAVSDHATALTHYEEALDAMEADLQARPSLAESLRRRVIMLAASVYQLCLQQMDADGMARCAQRIEEQVRALPEAGGDTGALLQGMLASPAPGSADLSAVVEQWSLASMGRATVEQAAVLVPLYRAMAARDLGADAEAGQFFETALRAAQHASEGQRHFLEATVLGAWKQHEAALAAFDRHLAQGGANAGFTGILGKLMSEVGGGMGEAERRIQQVRTHEQAFAFFVVTKAYERARTEWDALVAMDGEDWWKGSAKPWEELCTRGEMHEGLGDCPSALRSYEQAIGELEARRQRLTRDELKSAFAANRSVQALYFFAARAALKSGDWARAFHHVENGKARALLDLMAAAVPTGKADAGPLRHWRELNARLALTRGLLAQARGASEKEARAIEELTQRIGVEEEHVRQAETELAERHPGFGQVVATTARTFSLDEAAAALPAETVLLQFAFLGEELLAWAITREGMVQSQVVSLDAKALSRQIRAFHRACARRGNIGGLDEALSRTLLTPFASTIRAHARIIVVPYGTSHLLPFHALPFDGQPLAATRSVSYLPSASTLQFLAGPARSAPTSILAVGNPTGDLPAAAVEAQFVASLYGQSALIGEQATEENVRGQIASHRLLHFATHGKLSAEAPLSSSIRLAGGDELTVAELMGLQLDADLVVLSACETGRGEVTGGDDVLGLTRALLAAGARAALVSLWPVDDLSTSLFMGEFYRRLRAGETAGDALQAAQNYLRTMDHEKQRAALAEPLARAAAIPSSRSNARHFQIDFVSPTTGDYRHEYYWAPFSLIGRDWS